jgi:hypothetical protein
MRPRLFTVICVVSLLPSLTLAILWARSYRVAEEWTWRRADGDRSIRTMGGTFAIAWDLGAASQMNQPHGLRYEQNALVCGIDPILLMCSDSGEIYAYWQRGGFEWIKKDRPRSGTYMARAIAPFWSIIGVTALLPLAWTTMQVRSRACQRKRHGRLLCRNCGYDVRATPERCPECGTVVMISSGSAARRTDAARLFALGRP